MEKSNTETGQQIVEVERQLSWWEKTRIYGFYLLAALLVVIYRKPIWSLLRKFILRMTHWTNRSTNRSTNRTTNRHTNGHLIRIYNKKTKYFIKGVSQKATALLGFYLVSAIKETKVKFAESQMITRRIIWKTLGQMQKNEYLYTINKKHHK